MANKKAIIVGAHGQDGSYMYDLLISKGYETWPANKEEDLQKFILSLKPDEIYNFAGISDVINPYDNVTETMAVNIGIPASILESIKKYSPHTKFFQASSCLAITNSYPYGISKNAADELIKQYRENFGIYACSGIFYPHESPRRKDHFFTKNVINAVKNKEHITLGNLNVYREFGYAPEYVEAAWLMLQQDKPKDYEIGTGKPILLSEFMQKAFNAAGLNHNDFVTVDKTILSREGIICKNRTPIYEELDWYAKTSIDELIKIMLQ